MTSAEDIPTVTPHVFIRGEAGAIFKLDLPLHEAIEDRLRKGYLSLVKNMAGDPLNDDDTIPVERPAINDSKSVWVGWAVAESKRRGTPITPDAAEAATKQDLIETYGLTPANK